MATYYVAKTTDGGSDSNPGTLASPKLTIRAGIGLLSPGDTLVIRSGAYDESIHVDLFGVPNGTAGNPITIMAETPGAVFMTPTALGAIILADNSYLTFRDIIIDGTNFPEALGRNQPGIGLNTNTHHCRFENMTVRNWYYNLVGTSNLQHDNVWTGGSYHDSFHASNNGYGLYVSGQNNIIEYAEVYNCGGYGVHNYYQFGGVNGTIIRYNRIHDCGTGILTSSGIGNQVYGNVLYNNDREQISLYGGTNILCYNNSIYAALNRIGIQNNPDNINVSIRNNIIHNTNQPINDLAVGTTISNNLAGVSGTGISVVEASSATFANATGGDFQLKPTSGAIDGGVDVGLAFTGPAPDIGALEYPNGMADLGGGFTPLPSLPPPLPDVTPGGGGGVPSVGGGGGTIGGSGGTGTAGGGGGGLGGITFAREDLHHLDLVMDQSRAQWDWVIAILSLYNSAPIYSNGKYKIITDRADLPLRQVFHAGNTVPGQTEIRIGGNPLKPNQISVQFADQNIHYTENVIIIQDSAQIFGAGAPIKSFDVALRGITRPTEAIREGSYLLLKNQRTRREATWATGLEGLAVEPGDRCKLGVLMTSFEAGYGGRALDGSSSHIVFDRPVDIRSGFPYELVVWHTAADTLEQRNIANPPGTWIVGSPTGGFFYPVQKGDRWALGISSEDLLNLRVNKVERQPSGRHIITAEQFEPVFPDIACPDSHTPVTSLFAPPSQPRSFSVTVFPDCTFCVSLFPAQVVTGTVTAPGTTYAIVNSPGLSIVGDDISARLSGSWSPVAGSIVGDTIRFTSGVASGQGRQIAGWYPDTNIFDGSRLVWWSPAINPRPGAGDGFSVTPRSNTTVGARVYWLPPTGMHVPGAASSANSGWVEIGHFDGLFGCVDISNTTENPVISVVPVSSWGVPNKAGMTVFSLQAPGCQNLESFVNVVSVAGQAPAPLYSLTFPGSLLGLGGSTVGEIATLVSETCSPALESTELSFSLLYGSQTLVGSLVVTLNDATAQSVIGLNQPATIKFQIQNLGVESAQTAALMYTGPSNSGYVVLTKPGAGTVNTTMPQTLSVIATFNHFNTIGTHSHNCFGITATQAAQVIPGNDATSGALMPLPFTSPTLIPASTTFVLSQASGLGLVNSGANFVLITHSLGNASAIVNVTVNWNTTVWNSSFTANAQMANFGTVAPSGAAVYWTAK